jgi:hypothetical protein
VCIAGPLAVGGLAWSASTPADWIAAAGLTVVMVAELWLAGPWSMIGRTWRRSARPVAGNFGATTW